MKKRVVSLIAGIVLLCSMLATTVLADGTVASVGSTDYQTIEEALAAWTKNTTLTLKSDVTLPDVFTIKSTEKHTLNLGTFTLTAAEGKNAFEIIACGTGNSEQYALVIQADTTNPGSINAGNKAIVYYDYSKGKISANDRPIIKVEGGIFNGSTSAWGTAGIYAKGTAARKCATINISGGTFNCTINGTGKSKMLISGGTFNYSVGSQGDSTCYRLISGGKFKSFGFMTADAANKFGVGSALSTYDRGCYVDENGYLVVGGPVITECGTYAASTVGTAWNSSLKYSSVASNPLYWESVDVALKKVPSGKITIYTTDEIDLQNSTFKGTLVMPKVSSTIKVTLKEGAVPSWKVGTDLENYVIAYTSAVDSGIETRTYFLVPAGVNSTDRGSVAGVAPTEQGKGAIGATAKDGFYFDFWSVETVGGTANYTENPLAVDPAAIPAKITANFAAKSYEGVPAAIFAAPDKLMGLEAGKQYAITVGGAAADYTADAAGSIVVDESWYGKSLEIVKKSSDYKHMDSVAQTLEIPARYTFTYVVDEAETSTFVLAGEKVPAYEGELVKSGYLFDGWFTADEEAYDLETVVNEDITVYAQWSVKPAQTIEWDATDRTATYGDGDLEARAATAEGALTYSSSDESVATVDQNGVVTVLKAGETTISVVAAETATQGMAEASYKLTVKKATLTITAASHTVYIGDEKPELSYEVKGFAGDDAFIKTPSCSVDADWSKEGVYPIVLADADAGENYIINYVNGTVIVESAEEVCEQDETCPVQNYADTEEEAWYHDGVHYCVETGLMEGVSEEQFAPLEDASRAMVVTTLWRMAGSPIVESDIHFEDVEEDQWYTEAIRWAAFEGIVVGYGDGTFGAEDACTREQLAAILYRYAQSTGNEFVALKARKAYIDLEEVSDWASDAMQWTSAAGILQGKPGNVLDPQGVVTRAETAVMLQRYNNAI